GRERRENGDRRAERLPLFQSRRGWWSAVGRKNRRRDAAAGLRDLLARLERVDPDHVRVALLDVRYAARDRLFEGPALGANDVAASANHEVRINRIARCRGRPIFADRFFLRDAAAARAGPRFLGRFLVLDVEGGGARPNE